MISEIITGIIHSMYLYAHFVHDLMMKAVGEGMKHSCNYYDHHIVKKAFG